jgi:dihydropteroate synthase
MTDILVTEVSDPLSLLLKVGVDPASVPIFERKGKFISLMIYNVDVIAANVIKQEMLAAGADAAVNKHAITHKIQKTNVLTFGTIAQHIKLIEKLSKMHYWKLDQIADMIQKCLFKDQVRSIDLPSGRKLIFDRTLIMGIVNVTPDSFYSKSRVEKDKVIDYTASMIKNGVDIIDIGAESTRPGSERVSLEEELNRAIPAIEAIRKTFDIPISIDTYKSEVAKQAIMAGADIVNDVSALRFDEKMIDVISEYKPAVVLMHMKGEPKTMQQNPYYEDVIEELLYFFNERLSMLGKIGLMDKVIIDPGIGFGKRLSDNLQILKRIDEFKTFKVPILVGHSRKSFIGALLNNVPPEERLIATLAVTAYCTMKKVDIIRIHDVAENSQVVRMISHLVR